MSLSIAAPFLAGAMAASAQSPSPATPPQQPGSSMLDLYKVLPTGPHWDDYQPSPDSLPQPGVPKGQSVNFELESKIFPGTKRTISIYVPGGYKGDKPACVYVGLDGLSFRAPVVFDNLIFKKEMPMIIAIGVPPGQIPSTNPPHNPRFNRSLEFDSLNGRLARFLLEEVLPAVEKQKTAEGLPILLSKDPNDRMIGGGSTGGIGAFNVAWERPDAFRRVFTSVGTFVGMRGGDRYPVLVRKTEPKPIRICMQDGLHDNNRDVGDWWMANVMMQRALAYAGYDVNYAWGTGAHSQKMAEAIFPDAVRWLWRDWPKPIKSGTSNSQVIKAILEPGQDWQLIADAGNATDAMTTDPQGAMVFRDGVTKKIYKIGPDGKVAEYRGVTGTGLAFGADGRLYAADLSGEGKIVAIDPSGKVSTVATGIRGRYLTVTHSGNLYVAEEGEAGKLWLIDPSGKKTMLDSGLKGASGVSLSPDGLWLLAGESQTHIGYLYQVQPDGTLRYKEPFYQFYVPDTADDSGVGGICMDREGQAYAATRVGVQVMDRNGRVRAILPLPGNEQATSVSFGGEHFNTLYVTTSEGKVYQRQMKASGAPAWAAPFDLPEWQQW